MIALKIGTFPVTGDPVEIQILPELSGDILENVISVDALAVAFGC